jgi:hypothetical protein
MTLLIAGGSSRTRAGVGDRRTVVAATVKKAGIKRRGVWGGKNGTLFPHLPEIKSSKDAASDHAALWVELDI